MIRQQTLCLISASLLVVASIWTGIEGFPFQGNKPSQDAADERSPYFHARSVIDYTRRELIEWIPKLRKVEFAQTQEGLPALLDGVGETVEEFYRDFPSIYALENIYLETEGPGRQEWLEYLRLSYHYVISENSMNNELGFDEYRTRTNLKNERVTIANLKQAYLLTSGCASQVLFFHPRMRAACSFRFIGTEPAGHKAAVIAFAQIPEKTKTTGSIIIRQRRVAIMLQGVVWIEPETRQILRMQSDLLVRRSDVGLGQLTTQIDFEGVAFPGLSGTRWLPREVRVTLQCDGHSYRNFHRYSQYKLFSVESQDGPRKLARP